MNLYDDIEIIISELAAHSFVLSTTQMYVHHFSTKIGLEDFVNAVTESIRVDLRRNIEQMLMHDKKLIPDNVVPLRSRKLVLVKK